MYINKGKEQSSFPFFIEVTMGIFSDKKKTHVATEVARVYPSNDIPTLRKKANIKAVFDDVKFSEAIQSTLKESFSIKAERGYRKAANGGYYWGTPGGVMYRTDDGKKLVQNILEAKHGTTVSFVYYHFAPINNIHLAWAILNEDYQYNDITNTLVLDGKEHWVTRIEGRVNTQAITSDESADVVEERTPDPGTLSLWESDAQNRYAPRTDFNKQPVWSFGDDVEDGAIVYVIDADGNAQQIFISTSDYSRDIESHQAKYTFRKGNKREVGYFTYQQNRGDYPSLDSVFERRNTGAGSFFPVFIFFAKGRNYGSYKRRNTEYYKSSVKLADYMGLDYEMLAQGVEQNPAADNLEQAIMMMGVPAKTDDPAESEYLYRFFDWIYKTSPSRSDYKTNYYDNNRPGYSFSVKEKDFETKISFSSIKRYNRKGVIGSVNSYRCDEKSGSYGERINRFKGGAWFLDNLSMLSNSISYKKQVTKNAYQEIVVTGLSIKYEIADGKSVSANVSSSKMLIPLDYYITKDMQFHVKESLYYTSLHFVFNTKRTETIKWYQRDAFKIFMIVVAIVITVVTAGWGAPAGASLAAIALTVVEALVINIIIGIAVKKVAEIVIDKFGRDAAIVLAAIAIVAAAYGGFTGADWSSHAIAASNNITSAVHEDMKDTLVGYKEDAQEFELLKEEKVKELEDVNTLIDDYALLDPRSFIRKEPMFIAGEKPDDLFMRTVETGNPGILVYDYLDSYVEIETQLPTFEDLVGETFV